ncbi:MAG: DUF1449 family protein [Anaerolineales bacterium]|nr:DUF1449 family protein [Anaerolineales bacterium]
MLTQLWGFLTAWYNLPFTALLALGLGLAGAQWLGLAEDADDEVDAEADLAADADVDVDGAPEADLDEPPAWAGLAHLGVGKAPLLVIGVLFFSLSGGLGWLLNSLVLNVFSHYPSLAVLGTLPLALLAGAGLTAQAARLIGRALPPISTTASRSPALVGQTGRVISPLVDGRYGLVHLRNPGGTLISVFAVTDHADPIRRGETVVLAAYDAQHRRYLVTRAGLPELSPP